MDDSIEPKQTRGRQPPGWIWGLAVFVVVGLLYSATAARTIVGGDNAEFVVTSTSLGFTHPSGYPLLSLLLHGMHLLPFDSPAHAAAVGTALVGAGAVALLYVACRAWSASRGASLVVSLFFATTPLMWEYSTKAEVFALNAAILAAVVACAGPRFSARPAVRAGLLGAVAGLGLANNHTCVLVAPLGIWALVGCVRDARSRAQALGVALAAGVLMLVAPYLTLYSLVDPDKAVFSWGDITSFRDLARMWLRLDYGTFSLTAGGTTGPTEQILALLRAQLLQLNVLFILGLVGLVALMRQPGRRLAGGLFALSWLLSGPGLVALFRTDLVNTGAAMVQKFYLASEVLLVVPAGVALSSLIKRLPNIERLLERKGGYVLFSAATFIALASVNIETVRAGQSPVLHSYLLDTLEPLPPKAVVLGSGDHRVFGSLYVQGVLGVRRDVEFIVPNMLHYRWYRDRVSRRIQCRLPEPRHKNINTVELAAALMECGRPVFLTNVFTDAIPRNFATFPYGTTIAVLPPGRVPPPPEKAIQLNANLFDHFRHTPEQTLTDPWSREIRANYARTWDALSKASQGVDTPSRREARARLLRWTGEE